MRVSVVTCQGSAVRGVTRPAQVVRMPPTTRAPTSTMAKRPAGPRKMHTRRSLRANSPSRAVTVMAFTENRPPGT